MHSFGTSKLRRKLVIGQLAVLVHVQLIEVVDNHPEQVRVRTHAHHVEYDELIEEAYCIVHYREFRKGATLAGGTREKSAKRHELNCEHNSLMRMMKIQFGGCAPRKRDKKEQKRQVTQEKEVLKDII